MTRKHIKFWLLGGCAIAIISGASLAADDHGQDHDHDHAAEEASESHDDHAHGDEHGHEEEGIIHLTATQIKDAGITVASVASGAISQTISAPGRITIDEGRMAEVAPKVGGTVTEVKKNLGDTVAKGDILATIESREMADAAAEYHAASKSEELARRTMSREKTLWEKKITAEQDYINARGAYEEASIRTNLARQKLKTLGHDGKGNISSVHTLHAPIAGRIINRDITTGAFADTAKAAFTVADLGVVWVEISISPTDLPAAAEGQNAHIIAGKQEGAGKIIFLSPAINPETGAAKAIIALDNEDGAWRPGLFVTATIAPDAQDTTLSVPSDAIQSIDEKTTVFVRTSEGFEKRDVTIGRKDGKNTEILSGLAAGESIAVTNTFTIKAELGKAEAEHSH